MTTTKITATYSNSTNLVDKFVVSAPVELCDAPSASADLSSPTPRMDTGVLSSQLQQKQRALYGLLAGLRAVQASINDELTTRMAQTASNSGSVHDHNVPCLNGDSEEMMEEEDADLA